MNKHHLIAGLIITAAVALGGCGGDSSGLNADQQECVNKFNLAPGTSTMYLQTMLTVVTGKPINTALQQTRVAVGREADFHDKCLVTVTYPFYGSTDISQREERFTQFEFPATWNPATDMYASQFKQLGDNERGSAMSDMPDSVKTALDPMVTLQPAPPSSTRRNFGVESVPPLNLVFKQS